MAPVSAELQRSSDPDRWVWLFRLAFTCALVISAVVLAFFGWGIQDGSISSFNVTLWLAVLAFVAAVPLIGWRLRLRGRLAAALLVLSILVLPSLLYGLFILLLLLAGVSWN